MDILTHTVSSFALGTVVASYGEQSSWRRATILACSALAGAIPDIDAISLWSRFDATIGRFFHLSHSGREIYSAKFWYSHHAFMHSLLAALTVALIVVVLAYSRTLFRDGVSTWWRRGRVVLLSMCLAFSVHLFEDMPTPSSTWGGVRLFFPFTTYIGGTGDIWWWNNYDIFLIALGVSLINLSLLFLVKLFRSRRFKLFRFTLSLFLFAFALGFYQVKMRPYDFAYSGHTSKYQQYEEQSKAVQRKILGERLYSVMDWFDRKLPIYF
ncbi:MAG: hypothetical protein CSA97_01900 [Bacteroidetes bacterium]|nr:MAG: hypothetical protein CSA97_01900 [Bacteroidota bacterium]